MRAGKLKSHPGNGLLAGSISALAVSVFTIQSFRPGVLGPPWWIAWCVASILIGGGAGFVGGMLVNLIPVRLNPAVSYISINFFVGILPTEIGEPLSLTWTMLASFLACRGVVHSWAKEVILQGRKSNENRAVIA